MKKNVVANWIAIALSTVSTGIYAQELINNGSFDGNTLTENSQSHTADNWQFSSSNGAGIFNPTASQYENHALLHNIAFASAGASISQDLGQPLDLEQQYTIHVKVGWRHDNDAYHYKLGLRINDQFIDMTPSTELIKGNFVQVSAQFSPNAGHQALIDSGANIILELQNSDTQLSIIDFDDVSVHVAPKQRDSDNDGMSDIWEIQYGLNPIDANDALLDLDNDNAANLNEFLAATDPNDPTSTPNLFPHYFNSNVEVAGAIRLVPSASEPINCTSIHEGSIYYSKLERKVFICDGNLWTEFKGAQGEQGIQGVQGIQGIQGTQGVQGETGDIGPIGIPGIQGIQGIQGVPGTTHWNDGANTVSTNVKVGVGTTSPSAALEVIGNAIADTPTLPNHLVTKQYVDAVNTDLLTKYNALLAQLTTLNKQVFPSDGISCASVLAQNPNAPSNIYLIDADGPGGEAAQQYFCDMQNVDASRPTLPGQTTGEDDNIALVHTNALLPNSYRASGTVNAFSPAGAFDGHLYYTDPNAKINPHAGNLITHGIWLGPTPSDEWLQVNFGKKTVITGFKTQVTTHFAESSPRTPKDVIFQVSDDGVNFVDHEHITMEKGTANVTLNRAAFGKYFRLLTLTTHGSTDYTQIDEMEYYGFFVEEHTTPPVSQGTTCQSIQANNSSAASGYFHMDPDGAGGLPAFTTYCDMDLKGGGWTLVGIRYVPGKAYDHINDFDVLFTETSNITSFDDNYHLGDAQWQYLKNNSQELLLSMNDVGIYALADISTLKNANCIPLADTLGRLPNKTGEHQFRLFWHETSGCSGVGTDYSMLNYHNIYNYTGDVYKDTNITTYVVENTTYIYVR